MNIRKIVIVTAIGLVLLLSVGTVIGGESNATYLPAVYKSYDKTSSSNTTEEDLYPCPTATIPPIVVTAVYVTRVPSCGPVVGTVTTVPYP